MATDSLTLGPEESSEPNSRQTRVLLVDMHKACEHKFENTQGNLDGISDMKWREETPDYQHLKEAADCLRTSDIPVAFPTETVYGLGADATRSSAVKGIYAAKQRPSDNPLIVHFSSLTQLRNLLQPNTLPDVEASNGMGVWPNGTSSARRKVVQQSRHDFSDDQDDPIPSIYKPLLSKFWPGPLTILLPLPFPSPLAPEVTAGLQTFGARIPANPLALALIHLAGIPIAAPSANASTKPSPTTASHVLHDLKGRIDLIVDGGPCDVGVESTVVDGLCDPPVVLRPGGISIEMLQACEGWENCQIGYKDASEKGGVPRAPGMKYRHYSPRARVVLFEAGSHTSLEEQKALLDGVKVIGLITTGCKVWPFTACKGGRPDNETSFLASESGEVEMRHLPLGAETVEIAHNLFSALRTLDGLNVDAIFVEGIPDEGSIAAAVMNRLRKAAEVTVTSDGMTTSV